LGGFCLSLTPRRLEALATLQRLTEQSGEAVHYSLVASRMRISAWTAYDLLRELEGLGLVARAVSTEPRSSAGGRSRTLFKPLRQPVPLEPDEAAGRLRESFNRFAAMADETSAARAYLAEPAADLAYQLGFWLSRLEAAGRQAADAAATVLEGGARPAAKIQVVAAMGMGSALARLERSRLASRLSTAATRFSLLLDETAGASDRGLSALAEAARTLGSSLPAPKEVTP
jgi:hypothetical protein